MFYKEIPPHSSLSNYIDTYWISQNNIGNKITTKILPDACVDIIFNLGNDCITDNGDVLLKNDKTYCVGTMSNFKNVILNDESFLLGVRFKPGAFSVFYTHLPLSEITNKTILLENHLPCDMKKSIHFSIEYLDKFFINKFKAPDHLLLGIIETIKVCQGQIKVDALAKKHFITPRQLERNFKQYIGVSPKEFIDIIRFRNALKLIHSRKENKSLLDVALESGYYDHAHLSNAFKYYTGTNPTLI